MQNTTKTATRQSKKGLSQTITLRLSLPEYRQIISESKKQQRSINQTVRLLLADKLNA